MKKSSLFSFISSCALPTTHGDFEMRVYRNTIGQDAMALVVRMYHGKKAYTKSEETKGSVGGAAAMFDQTDKERSIFLRVQDQCITSEIFGSIVNNNLMLLYHCYKDKLLRDFNSLHLKVMF